MLPCCALLFSDLLHLELILSVSPCLFLHLLRFPHVFIIFHDCSSCFLNVPLSLSLPVSTPLALSSTSSFRFSIVAPLLCFLLRCFPVLCCVAWELRCCAAMMLHCFVAACFHCFLAYCRPSSCGCFPFPFPFPLHLLISLPFTLLLLFHSPSSPLPLAPFCSPCFTPILSTPLSIFLSSPSSLLTFFPSFPFFTLFVHPSISQHLHPSARAFLRCVHVTVLLGCVGASRRCSDVALLLPCTRSHGHSASQTTRVPTSLPLCLFAFLKSSLPRLRPSLPFQHHVSVTCIRTSQTHSSFLPHHSCLPSFLLFSLPLPCFSLFRSVHASIFPLLAWLASGWVGSLMRGLFMFEVSVTRFFYKSVNKGLPQTYWIIIFQMPLSKSETPKKRSVKTGVLRRSSLMSVCPCRFFPSVPFRCFPYLPIPTDRCQQTWRLWSWEHKLNQPTGPLLST